MAQTARATFGRAMFQDQWHALAVVIMDRNTIKALKTFGIFDFSGRRDGAVVALHFAQQRYRQKPLKTTIPNTSHNAA